MTKLLINVLFLLFFVTAVQAQQASPAAPGLALDGRVRTEAVKLKGKVSIYAKNLETGEAYSLNADDRVRTASTIKLPIMVAVFALVADGKAAWTDELTLTASNKVQGSGILLEFGDGHKLTLRDAVNLMIVVSDNSATNMVLDSITADEVNARMDALGLKQTRSLRKIGGGGSSKAGDDPANKGFGIGVSTPREMVSLLEKLDRGEVLSAAASKEMIDLLKRQQYRDGIGRNMLGTVIAGKPGALDRLRSEAGIIFSPRGRIAMAITIDDMPDIQWTVDNPALVLLSHLSEILVEGLGKGQN
ncbi:MAG: serine hydrolase [Acidobacteria bacterium]|nr:serine hydrolase [Acidobacteriota bacterium]